MSTKATIPLAIAVAFCAVLAIIFWATGETTSAAFSTGGAALGLVMLVTFRSIGKRSSR